jgi:hypothetical protein
MRPQAFFKKIYSSIVGFGLVFGENGVDSNYVERTQEAFVPDFTLKLMNAWKVNYTGSVVNDMGRLAELYQDP